MEIQKGKRKNNKITIEDRPIEGTEEDKKGYIGTFLNEDINNNTAETTGFVINQNSGELFFIEATPYFIELKATLQKMQVFFTTFANNQPILVAPQGVNPSTALVQQAGDINTELTNLINKIP